MSPRAAWQLEALGFPDVYDFVRGKADWIGCGEPVEGDGPHYPLAGEVARRDELLICRLGDKTADLAAKMETTPHRYCVVVNEHDVVLGRVRQEAVAKAGPVVVEDIMESGPTTVRQTEPAEGLLQRMTKRNVPALLVTTAKGVLVGLATRDDLGELVARSK